MVTSYCVCVCVCMEIYIYISPSHWKINRDSGNILFFLCRKKHFLEEEGPNLAGTKSSAQSRGVGGSLKTAFVLPLYLGWRDSSIAGDFSFSG